MLQSLHAYLSRLLLADGFMEGVAALGLLLSLVSLAWNARQDRARKPRLTVSYVGVETERAQVPDGMGGMRPDPSHVSVMRLRLRVANASEEVPLTIIEIGYRKRNGRKMIPCDYSTGVSHTTTGVVRREYCSSLTLLASEAQIITLKTGNLGPSSQLTGIYVRCSRGHVAWLPRKTLRALLRHYSWPSSAPAPKESSYSR